MHGGVQRGQGAGGPHVRWPVVLCAVGWLVGGATAVLVAVVPDVLAGARSPSAHLLLTTADGFVALLVAYLLLGRFLRRWTLQDLFLAEAFVLLAAAGAVAELVPALGGEAPPGPAVVWSALLMRVTAAVLVVCAAFAGHHRRLTPRRRWLSAVPFVVVGAGLVIAWAARDALPSAIEVDEARGGLPTLDGHLLLLSGQALGALAFAAASLAFTAQALRHRDELVLSLGPACALAACARLIYVLYPSLYTDWVYAGDALRTAAYVVLLVGAAREIGAYWHGYVGAVVREDRRRLARELHDGVVQELGYLRSAASTSVPDQSAREDILGACDRALDEARAAVDALGRHPDEPLAMTLHRAAQQVAERYGGRVAVDLDDSIRADHERRHALVRITREAVSNALRHGRPQRVCVRLEPDGQLCRLVVEDDGTGFRPEEDAGTMHGGYGLTSMRDRARALPGTLTIRSAPGEGTAVVVTWPAGHGPGATAGTRTPSSRGSEEALR